jgi:1-acyl-sn-glycerol-3-phosphate acyltransferase
VSLRRAADRLSARLAGEYEEDQWGFDPEFAAAVEPVLDFLYDRWWRVRVSGAEHLPAGRALIVANHAGTLPWDAAMISTAVLRTTGRRARYLALEWAFELPFVSVLMRKTGGVVASPYNAMRLLDDDELVIAFPEGARGLAKPFGERYRLQRFGRAGFAELALRSGAPIVPTAVVGSEEIYPKLAELPVLARFARAPYFPVTPTFPWFGPLGVVPLPSRWRIAFSQPIHTARHGVAAADDRAHVFELAERVRDQLQRTLYQALVERGRAFI